MTQQVGFNGGVYNYAVAIKTSKNANDIASAFSIAMTNEISKTSKAAETGKATELTEAEKLEAFKKEIWDEINSMPRNPGQSVSIQISDGAFKRMMENPEFRNEMMSILRENGRVTLLPQWYAHFSDSSSIFTFTEDGCITACSWHNNYNNPPSFDNHAKDAFWTNRATKKDSYVKSIQIKTKVSKKKRRKPLEHIILERAMETKARNEEYYKRLSKKRRLSLEVIAISQYENQHYADFLGI